MLTDKAILHAQINGFYDEPSNWQFAKDKRNNNIVSGYGIGAIILEEGAFCHSKKMTAFRITPDFLYAKAGDIIYGCKYVKHSEDFTDLELFYPVYKKIFQKTKVSVDDLFNRIKQKVTAAKEERKAVLELIVSTVENNAVLFSVRYDRKLYADMYLVKEKQNVEFKCFDIKDDMVFAESSNNIRLSYSIHEIKARDKHFPHIARKRFIKINQLTKPNDIVVMFYNSEVYKIQIEYGSKKILLEPGTVVQI